MNIDDLNTVHGLTKEIERLRAGEEDGATPEMKLTAGQLWKRLLELNPTGRIEMLRSLLQSADEGAECRMQNHEFELDDTARRAFDLGTHLMQWNTARRLLIIYIGTLRKNQTGSIEQGTVADKLELFLTSGDREASRSVRLLCGHSWTEAGRRLECAEPVGPDGTHFGEHHAYVREGASADEELRMRYLEEENGELRRQLGLPSNQRKPG